MMYVIVPRVVTRLVGIGPSDFHTMTSMESSCAFKKISKKMSKFKMAATSTWQLIEITKNQQRLIYIL